MKVLVENVESLHVILNDFLRQTLQNEFQQFLELKQHPKAKSKKFVDESNQMMYLISFDIKIWSLLNIQILLACLLRWMKLAAVLVVAAWIVRPEDKDGP